MYLIDKLLILLIFSQTIAKPFCMFIEHLLCALFYMQKNSRARSRFCILLHTSQPCIKTNRSLVKNSEVFYSSDLLYQKNLFLKKLG